MVLLFDSPTNWYGYQIECYMYQAKILVWSHSRKNWETRISMKDLFLVQYYYRGNQMLNWFPMSRAGEYNVFFSSRMLEISQSESEELINRAMKINICTFNYILCNKPIFCFGYFWHYVTPICRNCCQRPILRENTVIYSSVHAGYLFACL